MRGTLLNLSALVGALKGTKSSGLAVPEFGGPTKMLTPLLELPKLAGFPEFPEDNPDAEMMVVRLPPGGVLHFFSV